MARASKVPQVPALAPPANVPSKGIKEWVVLGIDPSLSRTGIATCCIDEHNTARWAFVGSARPASSHYAEWKRSRMIALEARKRAAMARTSVLAEENVGLVLVMEYPPPMNDYLSGMNRVFNAVFFENSTLSVFSDYSEVWQMYVNAATLRKIMRLHETGDNKDENIARAYEFISSEAAPNLDSDACDAVMLAMAGRYCLSGIIHGFDTIPKLAAESMFDSNVVPKKEGKKMVEAPCGFVHKPQYWFENKLETLGLKVKDAAIMSTRLNTIHHVV